MSETLSDTNGIVAPDAINGAMLADHAFEGGVKLRIGEQWIDITEVGNILIQAGESYNAAFGLTAGQEEE